MNGPHPFVALLPVVSPPSSIAVSIHHSWVSEIPVASLS
ncbi:hypothetical protein FHR32_008692 [Streptosporangium album]|uniref:Uncharacterized protein n=1 Tax=Streptosporangium album TaxID=47479 RepID=A0A7W7S5J6_9ACTN|nr:hypothetical protein [Streptosporangium album]